MSEQTFEVTAMTCGHCVMAVIQTISEASVEVDLATGQAQVRGDNIDEKAMGGAVVEAGYGTR